MITFYLHAHDIKKIARMHKKMDIHAAVAVPGYFEDVSGAVFHGGQQVESLASDVTPRAVEAVVFTRVVLKPRQLSITYT